jgi:hypothetical protein
MGTVTKDMSHVSKLKLRELLNVSTGEFFTLGLGVEECPFIFHRPS